LFLLSQLRLSNLVVIIGDIVYVDFRGLVRYLVCITADRLLSGLGWLRSLFIGLFQLLSNLRIILRTPCIFRRHHRSRTIFLRSDRTPRTLHVGAVTRRHGLLLLLLVISLGTAKRQVFTGS
jgi:hypothetical protein